MEYTLIRKDIWIDFDWLARSEREIRTVLDQAGECMGLDPKACHPVGVYLAAGTVCRAVSSTDETGCDK